MGFFDINFNPQGEKNAKDIESLKKELIEARSIGNFAPWFNVSYTGEKNPGELGAVIEYELDYESLRMRSWQSYLDNEVTQTVIKKFVTWIIGKGLKVQSEPVKTVLKSEGITVPADFIQNIEARFKLFSDSKKSDHSELNNINRMAKTAYTNAIVGGDVLCLFRVDKKGQFNIQLIDGSHVKTPWSGDELSKSLERGNTLKNGIEQDKQGRHLAYHVRTVGENNVEVFRRILAKGKKSGKEMAFMIYGLGYRLDDNRGIPLVSTVLEMLKKLDRYREATVSSAEERAKIVFQITHEAFSEGDNPMIDAMAKSYNVDSNQDNPVDIGGKQLIENVVATTGKQAVNMGVGSKLESLDSKNDIYFKDFHEANVALICATIGIPPEVALSKYDSNFSASRAALKDWEHTINVEREHFSFQFYQRIYDFWLDLQISSNKIQAPGFIQGDDIVKAAYLKTRWVGANVPHIDPLKEVAAERLKLGDTGKSLPLTTAEAATEALNGGDYDQNVEQYAKELEESILKKVMVVEEKTEPIKEDKD